MTKLLPSLKEWFTPVQSLPAGLYQYISPAEDARNYRLHLRIEQDGSGILVVNASTILHLNQTAAEYAYCIVKNMTADEAAQRTASRYKVSRDQARLDYQNIVDRIQTLINTPDLDPETFLDFERKSPHRASLSAPLRLDCALTYRLNENESPENAPIERVKRELTTDEWKIILDKAAAAGIPQVIFTGGEPTLRQDLTELIGYVEKNGQVTGLITHGHQFKNSDLLNQIIEQGLDHIMLVLDEGSDKFWDALRMILAEDIFLAAHITLTDEAYESLPDLLDRLAEIGVRNISLSTKNPTNKDRLAEARALVAARQLELIWNLPVPYSAQNPVTLETASPDKLPDMGRDWVYVEPDGDVLPAQGINQVLGNLLKDPWEKIWKL